MVEPFGRAVLQFLLMLSIHLTKWPSNLTKANISFVHTKNCVQVYGSSQDGNSQFPQTGNNPGFHQLVKGQIVIHPYNQTLLGNKKEWTTDTGISKDNVKSFMLSKRNQTQKYYRIPFLWHLEIGKNHRDRNQITGCQGHREVLRC